MKQGLDITRQRLWCRVGKSCLFLAIMLTVSLFGASAWAAPFAYITNSVSNTVSVIDTSSNTVVATVFVGIYPWGVAVNPSGTRVYVANEDGTVSVIDTSSNTVVATIDVGTYSKGVAVNPSGTRV